MLIDRETTNIYIEETNQSLAEIEKNLLVLESMGANIDMSLAKRVYHAMHVIRNGASLLSFSQLKELSQKIENVLGLICNARLTPNPEVINILLQGVDRLYQLIDRIHSNEDMDIDEQSVLLTGLTSAVLPDDIKQSVTEVRDIPVPDSKHVFRIAEFNLIQVLEQGKNLYILIYDLIKDVQEKNDTPLNFVQLIQQHGEMIDSFFDIQSIGTLEEKNFSSEMPYFVLFASTLSYEQLSESMGIQPHQIKEVNSEIADLIQPKTRSKLSSAISSHHPKTDKKKRMDILNDLFCELKFAMDCFSCNMDNKLSVGEIRLQSVINSLQDLLNFENSVLASRILWKIGRNIRDHAYQSNIQAKLELQCGLIMMDHRILNRLIEPVTAIITKMTRLVQTNTPIQICLNMTKNEGMIQMTISFSNPQILTQETHLDYLVEEKKIQALCANLTQKFELKTGLIIAIRIPQNVFIVPGYGVVIDDHNYIVPRFNVKDCLTNLDPLMWREKNSSIAFNHKEQDIPVVGISNTDLSYYQNKKSLMVCEVGNQRFGLAADSTETFELDAICQPLSKQLDSNPFIAANCLLDDGQIAFVPDMGFLANKIS